MYSECKIYGPYISNKDGRSRVIAVYPSGKKRTISYPKYLVEIYLNRYLDDSETVDHIDGDFTNNDLKNLRVVDRKEHIKQDVLRRVEKEFIFTCTWCNKKYSVSANKVRYLNRHSATGFCSRTCSGKYGADVQRKRVKPINNKVKFEVTYYKAKSALEEIPNVEEQKIGELLTGNADDNAEA